MNRPLSQPTADGETDGCGRFELRLDGDRVILYGSGELDLSNAHEAMIARDFSGSVLTVDLTGVSFMDSTALGALLGLQEEITPADLELVVVEGGQVDRLLVVSGLAGRFTIIRR